MKKIFFPGIFCLILSSVIQVQAQNTFPATGNVGIGTTAPSAPLSFGTTLGDSKLALFDNGSERYGFGIQHYQFRFHLGNSAARYSFLGAEAGPELMTLTGTGNLGIGVINPGVKLEVNGKVRAGNYQVGIADVNAYSMEVGGSNPTQTNGRATIFLHHHNEIAHQLRYTSGTLFLEAAGNSVYGSSNTPNLVVGGNLGIGTTTPSAPLSFGTTSGNSKLALFDNGSERYGFGIQHYQFRFHLGNSAARYSFLAAEAGPELMTLTGTGNLGIGTSLASNPNNYKLAVNGTIGAKAVRVELTSTTWSDYVFLPSYRLRPLAEVESYIKANSHLPEVPSAAQVGKDGINLGEMDATLLKKIEELTLYLIEQNKQLHEQNKKLETQNKKIEVLEKQLAADRK